MSNDAPLTASPDSTEADSHACEQRLYTTALLAELVGAPVEAIRRWHRRGYLKPSKQAGRLAHFAMSEVHVARNLTALLAEGCSLGRVDKLVAQLAAAAPDVERPLTELAVVVQQGKLYLRRGADLAEPHGQLMIDFDLVDPASPATLALGPRLARLDEEPEPGGHGHAGEDRAFATADEARALAYDRQSEGDLGGAIDACRAALFAGGGAAEDHVLLAQLLYERGDLNAARERYYAALELDAEDVESRVSLGCLLAETGDTDLAAEALRGAVAQQPAFADAQYYLARTLDELGRPEEADGHWRAFLTIAPAGPWVDEAAERLDRADD